jgi:arsenite-transporting ATPase
VAELSFFIGKGGVGKTTLSAAYAVRTAAKSPQERVLLVSSDPAHSLADIFQVKLGATPRRLKVTPRTAVTLWEMDAAELFAGFMRRNRQELLRVIESGSLFTVDEISPLLDSALPGMAEMAALLAILDALESKKYSNIVVDTAPFGHTLRLFNLPEQFSRLLNFLEIAAGRDQAIAEGFGGRARRAGNAFVDEWREKLDRLTRAFASAKLFLVTTPENFAIQESQRCVEELRRSNSPGLAAVVMNRTIKAGGRCPRCVAVANKSASAFRLVRKKFAAGQYYQAADPGFPIAGVPLLLKFGEHVFRKRPWPKRNSRIVTEPHSRLGLKKVPWPALASPLTFVVGKGGVGKTTISAGLGFNTRRTSRTRVQICSVDPAPSLDDIFQARIGERPATVLGDDGFRASEFDAHALFRQWISELRDQVNAATMNRESGVQVDFAFERRMFSELLEIVPPGLDEVLAIVRIAEMLSDSAVKVLIDMAPTGHALELLKMPQRILTWARLLLKTLAAHRKLALVQNVAVKIAELELRARELSELLRSSRQSSIFAVMLPELLPDRETGRLLSQLDSLGLEVKAIFVNRMMLGEQSRCVRCRSAEASQRVVLTKLQRQHPSKDIFLVRNFDVEPAGKSGLRSLTSELWQVS